MEIRSYRDLRVWQLAMDLVEHVYKLTDRFPQHEIYGLTSQLRRAAVSVPSNMAEGPARRHWKEYLRHLSIAQSSLAEVETQAEIAARLTCVSAQEMARFEEFTASLGRQLYALRNALVDREG